VGGREPRPRRRDHDPYQVLAVASNGSLQLSREYQGSSNPSASYVIRRQFGTLAAWEGCIDGQGGTPPPAAPCFYFPAPTSSLVADDRREVGIAYEDAVFGLAASFVIDGSTTDATHTITLTADGANRHNGVAGTGVIVDALAGPNELVVSDANVTVEWLELRGLDGAATNVLLQNLLVHDFYEPAGGTNQAGIRFSGTAGKSVTIRNVMIWDGDQRGIEADEVGDSLTIENCSIDDMRDAAGSPRSGIYTNDTTGVVVRNTIATRSGTDFRVGGGSFAAASSHNVSQDASAPGLSPLIALASSLFVNPGVDLHLKAAAVAIDGGADLSASFRIDVDGGVRPAGPAWDRGADEFGATTAVKLQSFTATAADAAVALDWRTASELDNLGFHIYRSLAESGPWTRLTTTLIAGLGSSALGRAYSFRDTGLVNGTRYFYRLEDVDTRSKATAHGPVSAVPAAAGTAGADAGAGRGLGGGGVHQRNRLALLGAARLLAARRPRGGVARRGVARRALGHARAAHGRLLRAPRGLRPRSRVRPRLRRPERRGGGGAARPPRAGRGPGGARRAPGRRARPGGAALHGPRACRRGPGRDAGGHGRHRAGDAARGRPTGARLRRRRARAAPAECLPGRDEERCRADLPAALRPAQPDAHARAARRGEARLRRARAR